MRVYIAAHYSRKAEMIQMAQVLQEHGVDNTATWLTEPHAATTTMRSMPYSALYNYALRDLEDISRADALVLFSFDSLLPACRGGHNVEMGLALGLGKPVYIIGPHENIFHYLPKVMHFSDVAGLLEVLEAENGI